MKLSLITLIALVSTIAAQARPFHRPIIRPEVRDVCVVNLEREEYDFGRRAYRYDFVEAFTEFGPRACEMAENACERERSRQFQSWKYRCEEDFTRGPSRRSCEYRIETRFGFEPEVYSASGRFACEDAFRQCEKALIAKQSLPSWDSRWVGPRATCVQTSGNNPTPRPPRVVEASCRASLKAGRVGRDTGNYFSAVATARDYSEARQRACNEALLKCESQIRGTMFCEIID